MMQVGGRHSKACQNCRTRRIKCDLQIPACSQCLRARLKCMGYRNPQSLMFRNESKKVIDRARAAQKPPSELLSASQTLPTTIASLQAGSSLYSPERALSISFSEERSLTPPKLNAGIEFFIDNYTAFISSHLAGRAALSTSPAWTLLFQNPAYASACSAAGYAGLANVTRDAAHMISARKKYALSLKSIESTLKDESSLAMSFESSMILTVFEIVNAGSWGIHIQGGAAIWKRMADHKLTPRPRTQLYYSFFIFMKCIISEEHSPAGMEAWSQDVAKIMSPEDAYAPLIASVANRFTNLYASVKNGNILDPSTIVHQAIALEVELDLWEQELPRSWRFTLSDCVEQHEFAFQGKFHQYHEFWIARMLNNYRWVRILINNLLLMHLPSNSPRRASCSLTIARLSADIFHSIPSFLESTIIQADQKAPFPVLAGCFQVIFPLAVVGCAIGISDGMHEWAVQMLGKLGDRMGIVSATQLVFHVRRLRVELANYGKVKGYGQEAQLTDERQDIHPDE